MYRRALSVPVYITGVDASTPECSEDFTLSMYSMYQWSVPKGAAGQII